MTTTPISKALRPVPPGAPVRAADPVTPVSTASVLVGGPEGGARAAEGAVVAGAPVALHLLAAPSVDSFLRQVEGIMLEGRTAVLDLGRLPAHLIDALVRALPSFALSCVVPVLVKSSNETSGRARKVIARLRYAHSLLGTALSDRSMAELAPELADSATHELMLPLRQGGGDGMKSLVRALPRSNVARFSAPWGQPDERTLRELCLAIEHAPQLGHVDLRSNQLQPEDMEAFGHATSRRAASYPLSLALVANPIGDEGVEALCVSGALGGGSGATSGYIDRLDLSGCQITDRGIAALSVALPESELTELLLRNALLSSIGIRSFIQSVRSSRLQRLDLRGIPMPEGDHLLLDKLMEEMPSLTLRHRAQTAGMAGD